MSHSRELRQSSLGDVLLIEKHASGGDFSGCLILISLAVGIVLIIVAISYFISGDLMAATLCSGGVIASFVVFIFLSLKGKPRDKYSIALCEHGLERRTGDTTVVDRLIFDEDLLISNINVKHYVNLLPSHTSYHYSVANKMNPSDRWKFSSDSDVGRTFAEGLDKQIGTFYERYFGEALEPVYARVVLDLSNGESVDFGPLRLRQNELEWAGISRSLEEIDRLSIKEGQVTIFFRDHCEKPWVTSVTIDNFLILIVILSGRVSVVGEISKWRRWLGE